jgi:hypothetical protein
MKTKIVYIILFLLINIQIVYSKLQEKDKKDFSLDELNKYNNINNNNFLGKSENNSETYNNIILSSENNVKWFNLHNIDYFTYFHLILCFLLVPALSIILILIDMKQDKTIKKNIGLPSNEKVKNEYNLFKKSFIISAKYLFSWFLFKYHYPITNIIFVYNYNHPRYIRLIIYITTILFNTLIISILLIQIMDQSIYSYYNFGKILVSLIFTFIISIIMDFVLNFISKFIFEFHLIRREIFKTKLEILRRYIYYVVKKDILFNSKWHLIRNRMITYYRLCGPLLLSQVKKNKYQRYVKNKLKEPAGENALFSISVDKSLNNSSFLINTLNKSDILKEVNEIDTKENKIEISNKKRKSAELEDIKEKLNEKDKKSKFRISKGAEPFSFSKYGINNMKLKTVKKIEDIKNRYINKKKEIKFDETIEIDKEVKIFENLDIESLEGYTYISTDAMIDKINIIKTNSNKMIINIFTNVILLIIMLLVNLALLILELGETARNPNNPIRDFFLVIFFYSIIINFIIHKVICLFIAFSIHKFYGKKKRNCCYKLIFNIYYEKYIRYLYRIRLLITKYQKELNFIEK